LAADGGPRRPKRWSGKSGGKNEKLGIVPMDKLAFVVPTKVWDAHRKNLAALAPAEEAAATSKAAVLAARRSNCPTLTAFRSTPTRRRWWSCGGQKRSRRAARPALRDLTAAKSLQPRAVPLGSPSWGAFSFAAGAPVRRWRIAKH
jgi:hypothetical protein